MNRSIKRHATNILGLTLAVCIVSQWMLPALASFVALTVASAKDRFKD